MKIRSIINAVGSMLGFCGAPSAAAAASKQGGLGAFSKLDHESVRFQAEPAAKQERKHQRERAIGRGSVMRLVERPGLNQRQLRKRARRRDAAGLRTAYA